MKFLICALTHCVVFGFKVGDAYVRHISGQGYEAPEHSVLCEGRHDALLLWGDMRVDDPKGHATFLLTLPPISIHRYPMSNTIYTASIPVFQQMLGGLKKVLSKAEAHATDKKIDPNAYLQARLYPDMFPLLRQVQIASDFAKGVAARLAGVEVPKFDDNEQTFTELQARIDTVLAFMGTLTEAQFVDAAEREIVLQPGTPKERRFPGSAYLLTYGLPQFFFHSTSAYAILRHNGIEVGKKDYMNL